MPLHPNSRDIGKNTPSPRAEYPAPHTAVDTARHAFPPDRDAVPHIVMGMHGRDYALQEPTDNHIVLATQRMRATYSDAANATTRYYTTLNATYLYGELTGQLRRQSLSHILIPNTCNAVKLKDKLTR